MTFYEIKNSAKIEKDQSGTNENRRSDWDVNYLVL